MWPLSTTLFFLVLLITHSRAATTWSARLIGGGAACQGSVWIEGYNAYGFVCDDGWGTTDADVICSSLGYGNGVDSSSSAFGQRKIGYVMTDVECTSTASSINACPFSHSTSSCTVGTEISSVVCAACVSSFGASNGDVRLVGGATPCEGSVQVFYNSAWGYLKVDAMDQNVANAVCKSAGFTGASQYSALTKSTFGSALTTSYPQYSVTGVICNSGDSMAQCTLSRSGLVTVSDGLLASVACTGAASCSYNSWGGTDYVEGGIHNGTVWYAPSTGGVTDYTLPLVMGCTFGPLFLLFFAYVFLMKRKMKKAARVRAAAVKPRPKEVTPKPVPITHSPQTYTPAPSAARTEVKRSKPVEAASANVMHGGDVADGGDDGDCGDDAVDQEIMIQ